MIIIKRHITKYAFLLAILILAPIDAISKSGCCSWHGGVSHCDDKSGKYVCNDGSYSPSCLCESNHDTRHTESSLTNQISEEGYRSQIGNCPCPYNLDNAGKICGKRSAWCRKGGYSPVCDLTKITHDIIEECNKGG